MPEESGAWNGRGQIKAAGLPRRSGRQRGRLCCHARGRGIVEDSSYQLGGGIVNLSPFLPSSHKKKGLGLIFFSPGTHILV